MIIVKHDTLASESHTELIERIEGVLELHRKRGDEILAVVPGLGNTPLSFRVTIFWEGKI